MDLPGPWFQSSLRDLLGLNHRACLVDRPARWLQLRLPGLLDLAGLLLPDHQAHLSHQPGLPDLADRLPLWLQLHLSDLVDRLGPDYLVDLAGQESPGKY